ncbi:heterocyst frequency control protein PatD [Leptolyngbya sp. AN02str]|uniref:heterocyst frequency control protein PatD n=1 Tax=Leptolyngbya sp. AN02str TaxID=3423363 RepID=UPI003D321BFD
MLPSSLVGLYQTFEQQVEELRSLALAANPDPLRVQESFIKAQQHFQTHIATSGVAIAPEYEPMVQSIQVEINKQLRLLAMDVMYLQTARQAMTTQRRQAQMGDRLQLLQTYCQNLLGSA